MLEIKYKDGTSERIDNFKSFDTASNLMLVFDNNDNLIKAVNILEIKEANIDCTNDKAQDQQNYVFKKACAPGSALPDDIVNDLPDDIISNIPQNVVSPKSIVSNLPDYIPVNKNGDIIYGIKNK